MDRRSGNKSVDARLLREFHSFAGAINIGIDGARETRNGVQQRLSPAQEVELEMYVAQARAQVDALPLADARERARYFGLARNVGDNSWFDVEVLKRQDAHQLIGTFGSQQFYA